jgi:class 3 adenylate cyclase
VAAAWQAAATLLETLPTLPGDAVVRVIGNDLHMDYSAIGQTTHLAARMEQLATPGSIRLTTETLRLAEGLIQIAAWCMSLSIPTIPGAGGCSKAPRWPMAVSCWSGAGPCTLASS